MEFQSFPVSIVKWLELWGNIEEVVSGILENIVNKSCIWSKVTLNKKWQLLIVHV